jgi:hypothetical protein
MATLNTTRWIGIGLLGLPLYGALTFWSSLEGQPDPSTQLEAWSRFVTTNEYVWGHLFGSIFGLIFVIFGLFALGAYLATSYAPRLGLAATVITVLFEALPPIFANTVQGLTGLVVILLGLVGNILVGVAVWRSGTLPKWAGALWAGAHVLMYLSLMYGQTIGPSSTPPTVPLGAVVVAISGAWMALSVLRGSSAQAVGAAQPKVP